MLLRNVDGTPGFIGSVDAPQRAQMRIVETLDAERQTVYTGLAISREASRFHRAGIGLQRDLRTEVERQQHAYLAQNLRNTLAAQQAGRAAAEEHRINLAPPDLRQGQFQVVNQRGYIFLLRKRAARLMRIEIAIRTLAHAPRDVDIQRQWR